MTAYDLAMRFVGTKEVSGAISNPLILAMLKLDNDWPEDDSTTPWCAAFTSFVCWLLRLPRSKSLAAKSWLGVGRPVSLTEAHVGFDVVILNRSDSPTAGHVGFYAGQDKDRVYVLGGNQGDAVSVAMFHVERIAGIRRLSEEASV